MMLLAVCLGLSVSPIKTKIIIFNNCCYADNVLSTKITTKCQENMEKKNCDKTAIVFFSFTFFIFISELSPRAQNVKNFKIQNQINPKTKWEMKINKSNEPVDAHATTMKFFFVIIFFSVCSSIFVGNHN